MQRGGGGAVCVASLRERWHGGEKAVKGGLGLCPYDRRGEEKEGGSVSHGATWRGGGLVRRALELEGAVTPAQARHHRTTRVCGESRGGGATTVSCWASCHGPEMNSDNFDLFKQFQNDFN
jgi:hypothetical protein